MKNHDLLDAVGGIDEKYIKNAGSEMRVATRRQNIWWKATAVAACVCLVATLGMIMPKLMHHSSESVKAPQIKSHVAVAKSQKKTTVKAGKIATKGIYIPAIKLPKTAKTVATDMISLIVYRGHIYTQAEDYFGEAAQRIASLVGDHLGTAMGNIDEWSSQSEFSKEFASTAQGEVYAVKGYDQSFRICLKAEVEDGEHNKTLWIQFLDCTNDITLSTGKDLFEDRLHLNGRIAKVVWQSHKDWDNAVANLHDTDLAETVWRQFWNEVMANEFINTWKDNKAGDLENGKTTIYDTPHQAHLVLIMQDNTLVRIRLIEGGYVGYDALRGYFVKIPENVFNAIYDICGGTH